MLMLDIVIKMLNAIIRIFRAFNLSFESIETLYRYRINSSPKKHTDIKNANVGPYPELSKEFT